MAKGSKKAAVSKAASKKAIKATKIKSEYSIAHQAIERSSDYPHGWKDDLLGSLRVLIDRLGEDEVIELTARYDNSKGFDIKACVDVSNPKGVLTPPQIVRLYSSLNGNEMTQVAMIRPNVPHGEINSTHILEAFDRLKFLSDEA